MRAVRLRRLGCKGHPAATRREESHREYVVLIHSNPQPWGHPTGDFVPEFQALPEEQRDAMNADFEAMLGEMSEQGELLGGEALADPSSSRLYRWETGKHARATASAHGSS